MKQYEPRKTVVLVLLCGVLVFNVSSCRTAPNPLVETPKTNNLITDAQTGQTGIAKDAATLQGNSDTLTVITKDLADNGATVEKIKTLTVYVDKNASVVKSLNEKVTAQTVTIGELSKSHTEDNVKMGEINQQRLKAEAARDFWRGIAFKLGGVCLLFLLGIAGYVIVKLKLFI